MNRQHELIQQNYQFPLYFDFDAEPEEIKVLEMTAGEGRYFFLIEHHEN